MKVALSPMASVNDNAFMDLCLSMGADLAFTEMISVNGLVSGNKKSYNMIPQDGEKKIVQLFGRDPISFLKSAEMVREKNGSNWVDINAGCPVKKVVKHGYGAALMKTPQLVRDIVEILRQNGFKVSIKIRVGWEKDRNYVEVAKAASDGGAFLVSIHGRTVEQGYSGKADWKCSKILKEKFKHLKIGLSGDLFTPMDAYNAMTENGVDLLLIARGAIGRPWIFGDIKNYLARRRAQPIKIERIKDIFNLHLDKTIEEHGIHGIIFFRKFLVAYLKGFPNSREIKIEALKEKNVEKVKAIVNGFFDKLISCEQGGVSRGDIES